MRTTAARRLAPLLVAGALLAAGYARYAPGVEHAQDLRAYLALAWEENRYSDIIFLYRRLPPGRPVPPGRPGEPPPTLPRRRPGIPGPDGRPLVPARVRADPPCLLRPDLRGPYRLRARRRRAAPPPAGRQSLVPGRLTGPRPLYRTELGSGGGRRDGGRPRRLRPPSGPVGRRGARRRGLAQVLPPRLPDRDPERAPPGAPLPRRPRDRRGGRLRQLVAQSPVRPDELRRLEHLLHLQPRPSCRWQPPGALPRSIDVRREPARRSARRSCSGGCC